MFLKAVLGKSLEEWSDQELVRAYTRRGRHYYFDELFNRYHEKIYGYCLSRTASREASKDLTLITFERAFTQLRSSTPARFDAWLFGIATNVCNKHIRAKYQDKEALRAFSQWQTPDFMPNEAFRSLIEAQELAKLEAFQAAIGQLSEEQRKCITHFHLEGCSYQQTAERTGYTLAQVKSYLQNGRRKLLNLLVR